MPAAYSARQVGQSDRSSLEKRIVGDKQHVAALLLEAGDCLIKVLLYAGARDAYLQGLCGRRFAQFSSLELDVRITGIY